MADYESVTDFRVQKIAGCCMLERPGHQCSNGALEKKMEPPASPRPTIELNSIVLFRHARKTHAPRSYPNFSYPFTMSKTTSDYLASRCSTLFCFKEEKTLCEVTAYPGKYFSGYSNFLERMNNRFVHQLIIGPTNIPKNSHRNLFFEIFLLN